MTGTVAGLVRYPVKSAAAEHLTETDVDRQGLRGDRMWACLDVGDGTVGSAKHPRRWGSLLQVTAHLEAGSNGDGGADGTVVLRLDGRTLVAGKPATDEALTEYLGRPVRLTRTVPAGARLHRRVPDQAGLVPDWMALAPGQDAVTPVSGARPGGRFTDFAAVHLVTTGALDLLARRLGEEAVAPERFRPNLVLDTAADPEPGQEVRVGAAVLRVLVPTPRCVVPGLPQAGEREDPALLGVLARHYRTEVGARGRAACFGMYAEVIQPGRVRVGDPVR